MTAILSRVLNGYKGSDLLGMIIEDLQRENLTLNASLSRLSARRSVKFFEAK